MTDCLVIGEEPCILPSQLCSTLPVRIYPVECVDMVELLSGSVQFCFRIEYGVIMSNGF